MSTIGLLSKGATLSYKKATVLTLLPDLLEIPDLGGKVDKVEVTTLADGNKRYINGLKDFGDLPFKFLYGNTLTDSFRVLSGLEATGTVQDWEIALPDGTKFAFSGFPSVKLNSAGVGAALTFNLDIALNSVMVITNPVV